MIDRPFHKGDRAQEQLLHQSIRALPDGWYEVKFKPHAGDVTASRGYLHGLVVGIYAAYLGECDRGQPWDDDEAWERCKKQFRPREYIDPATGAVEVVGRSTKGMTPTQVFELTMQVTEWLESQGVFVPPPDPDWQRARDRAIKRVLTEQG